MLSENTEDIAQNKLLLLYIIKSSPKSYTNEELTEFILYKNYMNYFTIQQYISELIEGNFITINTEENYEILDKGKITLEYFNSKIPQNIIDDLEKEFKLKQIIEKKEAEIIGEYFKKENDQFMVNLKLVENGETLFSLYFEVPSVEQAEVICNKWKENTEKIYQSIINTLI